MRRLAAVFLTMMLVGMFIPTAVVAAPNRVEICHFNADFDPDAPEWELLEVSSNGKALTRHEAHGDGFPLGEVPGTGGEYVFDANCVPELADSDGDGIIDNDDNCPTVANADQSDRYGSAKGDACEDDSDGDGFLDSDAVNEPHICVSIDGVVIVQRGASSCTSNLTIGASPNIAVIHGRGHVWAINGDNNTAILSSTSGGTNEAIAAAGSNNTAIVVGNNSSAWATAGNNNTATVVGNNSRATACCGGNNNTATVTGDGGTASAWGGNATATAIGACLVNARGGQTASCTGS